MFPAVFSRTFAAQTALGDVVPSLGAGAGALSARHNRLVFPEVRVPVSHSPLCAESPRPPLHMAQWASFLSPQMTVLPLKITHGPSL